MLSVRARLYFEGRTDVNEVLSIVKHVQTFVFEIVTRMSVNLSSPPTLMNIKKTCYRSKQAYLTAEATPDPTDILISIWKRTHK
jgi:hypothetical protein